VRLALRRALRAKRRGNLEESAEAFREALALAETLDRGGGTPQEDEAATARRTGIALALAGVLEDAGELDEAWRVYRKAMDELREKDEEREPGRRKRSETERLKAAGVAQKLGAIAERSGERAREVEARDAMEWALAELLRLSGKLEETKQEPGPLDEPREGGERGLLAGDELELPSWLTRTDLGASMENLASSYSRTGRPEYVYLAHRIIFERVENLIEHFFLVYSLAVPLYLQALSLLLRPSSRPSCKDKCHGATIVSVVSCFNTFYYDQMRLNQMNNISAQLTISAPTNELLEQASAWAKQAHEMARKTLREHEGPAVKSRKAKDEEDEDELAECRSVIAVAKLNLGLLQEVCILLLLLF
jgi:tetratricopeptide (TPR) repeat protein